MSQRWAWLLCFAVLACSSHPAEEKRSLRTSMALTSPVVIELKTPKSVAVLSPVLLASNTLSVGAFALIAQPPSAGAPSIALGSTGVQSEPDASLRDVWSRGPVILGDRVRLTGGVNAIEVRLGVDTVVTGPIDRAPAFEPLNTLAWQVKWPALIVGDVTLGP